MNRQEFEDFRIMRERNEQEQHRKRIGQAVRAAAYILAAFGVLLILGTAGRSDYADEVGELYPMSEILKWLAVGFTMMIPAGIAKARDRD